MRMQERLDREASHAAKSASAKSGSLSMIRDDEGSRRA
jgi:hypothetical protein